MNDLKLLASRRPDVRPMEPDERASMRAELFGVSSPPLSVVDEQRVLTGMVLDRRADRLPPSRRRAVALAAVVLAVVPLSLAMLALRDSASPAQQPVPTTRPSTAMSFESALSDLEPSREYLASVWLAREILIEECMAELGFDYQRRPFGPGSEKAATEWEAWFAAQVAAAPDFERAMQGGPNEQSGGCQLEAFQTVHGDGEEAYSKLSTLLNELLGDLPTDADRTPANIATWIAEHRSGIDVIRAELAEEQATAESIIAAHG